jgi:hypothetical protein
MKKEKNKARSLKFELIRLSDIIGHRSSVKRRPLEVLEHRHVAMS